MEKYQIIKPIGKGSYGDVFLVKNISDRKQYVLKKIFVKKSSKEKVLAQQEVKLLSELHHPNIVEYKESFSTDKGQYMCIVMAFCEGGDLFTRLKAQNKKYLNEKQIIDWFVQIALALHYLHQRKVLHRDLKTQNTFLTKNGIIKLGDFGIARVFDNSMDMAKTMIGTPYYMSPELFDNKPYNFKSDVWSLGCCVYEMTALRHAFDAKEMPTLIMKILKENPAPIPSHFSSDLSNLIKLMLTKSPSQRPSVADLLQLPFIKAHMQASVQDHYREKVQEPLSVPHSNVPVIQPSNVNKKPANNDVFSNRNRAKIAEELSQEEEVQKKLEVKLKKIEADLKHDQVKSARGERAPIKQNIQQNVERKPVSKQEDKQEVKIVGSKVPVPTRSDSARAVKREVPVKQDTPSSKVDPVASKLKKEGLPRPASYGKRDERPASTPRSNIAKDDPKKDGGSTPRSVVKPKDKDYSPYSTPSSTPREKKSPIVAKDKVSTPSYLKKPNPPIAFKEAPLEKVLDIKDDISQKIPSEDSKIDNPPVKSEMDLFAARIASLRKNPPTPKTNNQQDLKPAYDKETPPIPKKVELPPHSAVDDDDDDDEFPVVECSYDHNPVQDDSLEEDEIERTKVAAQLRDSTIKIKQITDALNDIEFDEREQEKEEVISIYDSYVKNGVDVIPEEEDEGEEIFMTGNLSDRINGLKVYCKEGLGESLFTKVYELMKSGAGESGTEDSIETHVENLIGPDKMNYFNFIRQIIFCEHSLQ